MANFKDTTPLNPPSDYEDAYVTYENEVAQLVLPEKAASEEPISVKSKLLNHRRRANRTKRAEAKPGEGSPEATRTSSAAVTTTSTRTDTPSVSDERALLAESLKKQDEPSFTEARDDILLKTLVPTAAEEASEDADRAPVLGVMIHRCERLKTSIGRSGSFSDQMTRSRVRVHLVDSGTGQLVNKQMSPGSATSQRETDKIAQILPMMTRPAEDSSISPVWEEALLFNGRFDYLCGWEPRVVLVFEVLAGGDQLKPVCWAFLRLLGAGGRPNVDHHLRLQLFRPPSDSSSQAASSWHRSVSRKTLPDVLHVTIQKLPYRQLHPGERPTFESVSGAKEDGATGVPDGENQKLPALPRWSRLDGQRCRLPNSSELKLAETSQGCTTLRFSASGERLACAVLMGDVWLLLVHWIPSGVLTHRLHGHGGPVQRLVWTSEQTLVSASVDWTVRVWRLERSGVRWRSHAVPHPGPVYDVITRGQLPSQLLTACGDGIVRLWQTEGEGDYGDAPRLIEELMTEAPAARCLCSTPDGCRLFVGHSDGSLVEWLWRGESGGGAAALVRRCRPLPDSSAAITHLQLTPDGRRLVVQLLQGVILLLDKQLLRTRQTLHGHLHCRSWQLHGDVTPCGRYYVSGSEDGSVHVWSLDTGESAAAYMALGGKQPVISVHFHPWEHMMAVSAFRDPSLSVQLLQCRAGGDGNSIGLTVYPRAIQPQTQPETSIRDHRQPSSTPSITTESVLTGSGEEDGRLRSVLQRLDAVIAEARNGVVKRQTSAESHQDIGGARPKTTIEVVNERVQPVAPPRRPRNSRPQPTVRTTRLPT